MMLFSFVAFFLLLGSFINPKKQSIYYFASFCVLFILIGFRGYEVGTDTPAYNRIFHNIESGIEGRYEVGYVYINKLIAYINGDFSHLLMLTGLMFLTPIFYTSKKISPNPMLSIFSFYTLYYYFSIYNIIRSSLAVALIFFGVTFLLNNKKLWFTFIVLIASTFHISALLCLPLVFIEKLPNNKNFYIVSIVLSWIIGLSFSTYFSIYIIKLLRFDNYLIHIGNRPMLTNAVAMGLSSIFFIFILVFTEKRDALFNLFFVSFLISNLLGLIPYSYRVVIYFNIFQILYFPVFIYQNKFNSKTIPFFTVIVYCLFIFYRTLGQGGIFPYYNSLF